MIRFLQTDNRVTKALLVVIIGAASVSMVVYLIPGLTGAGAASTDTYAMIYPHWYSRLLSSGVAVSQQRLDRVARQELARRSPQNADNPRALAFFETQVGPQLIQQQVLLAEAEKLGIRATNDDVIQLLHTGQTGQVLFPNGVFIGQEKYAALIAQNRNQSVDDFENDVKNDIVIRRLQSLITAGVTVSDQEVRDEYRKSNIKIKFDYAVISADDLIKGIDPPDSQLEKFFKDNAARYASAVPEQRQITYFAFLPNEIPGGVPQPSQQEIQQYFNQHQDEYSVPEQARSRHILIKLAPGADAKADAAAKAKAEGILKQIEGGADFAALAKANSDDPGSKDKGGELGFAKRGMMVPAFDNAIFTQKIGDTQIVKSQFGYHLVQVEERQSKHDQSINEVLPTIQATLIRQKAAAAEENYAHQLTSEAMQNGLEKTAAAHHLELVTTPPVNSNGVIAALPDGSQVIAKAFGAKQSDPPQFAPTGEGYAIFKVTGIVPAHAPNFNDWKSHVLDDYRQQVLAPLLSLKTKQLADKAKAENDLAKAAKEAGATMKTSELVDASGQVPDLGQIAQVAPQLLDLSVGQISGPIDAQRTGVVAKLIDKQQPTDAEIAKNFDQIRDQMLDQRRSEAFGVFLSDLMDNYKKSKRVMVYKKGDTPALPGT